MDLYNKFEKWTLLSFTVKIIVPPILIIIVLEGCHRSRRFFSTNIIIIAPQENL